MFDGVQVSRTKKPLFLARFRKNKLRRLTADVAVVLILQLSDLRGDTNAEEEQWVCGFVEFPQLLILTKTGAGRRSLPSYSMRQ